MPHSNEALVGSPFAMALREIALSVTADLHDMQSNIHHARRSCARAQQLFNSLGMPAAESPVRDNLAIAEAAVIKCQAIVDFGLDGGIAMMVKSAANASDPDPV
jgi:hypothetical protein